MPTSGNLTGVGFNALPSASVLSPRKTVIKRLLKINLISERVKLPFNKVIHENLILVAKKLESIEDIDSIYIHLNSIYVRFDGIDLNVVKAIFEIGVNIRKYFNKDVTVEIQEWLNFDTAIKFEAEATKMFYEEYRNDLHDNAANDLFGESSVIPFDKLPEYIRKGIFVKDTHVHITGIKPEKNTASNTMDFGDLYKIFKDLKLPLDGFTEALFHSDDDK